MFEKHLYIKQITRTWMRLEVKNEISQFRNLKNWADMIWDVYSSCKTKHL